MNDGLHDLDQIKGTLLDLALRFGPKLLTAIVILTVGGFVAGWVARTTERGLNRLDLEPPVRQLLTRVARVLVLGLFVIMALQNLGVEFRCSCRRLPRADPCLAQAKCLARRRGGRQRLVPAHGRRTPRREQDILSGIDIPVVSDTALHAYPCSYSKAVQTCRARAGPAVAAALRCVPLVDDDDASICPLALVQ
jgi:Conserved TM helix